VNQAPSGDTPSSQGEPQNPGSQDGNTLPMRGDTHAPPPRSSGAAQGSSVTSDKSGDRVGNYTLLEKIGSGGFGVVWRAERREPFVQQVAVKLLRPGMDSESVLARFEQERQSLALMDHPNIAKVIDGGITEGGRNYFVMELVKGEPITKFCDRHRLPIERRLELFAQACDAIQHAHMKGIIHRDLKPGNILAAMGEADGAEGFSARVKIIDFGVAKATARPLTERQLFTELGQMIGTPEYMSPEQADGGMDVDTRTDIYALGVVLYELLVGATPFDAKSLRSAGLAAIHRIIRDSEPPKPSDRLRAMTAATTSPDTPSAVTVAQERGTKSQTLMTRLREELEWLPMKAMRKERGERYRSAAEFADDIRNYLGGKPLIAGPESAAYRTRKFVRRHRAAVLSGALMSGVVVAAAVVSTIFWLGEAKQRRLAEERERQVRAVSEFQQDMLEQAKPEEVGAKLEKIILGRVMAKVDAAVPDPLERERRMQVVREAFRLVDAADLARDLLEEAILKPGDETADAQFGIGPRVDGESKAAVNLKDPGTFQKLKDPETLADLKQVLAIVQYAISKPELALPLQQSALTVRERLLEASNSSNHQRKLAQSLAWFGRILDAQKELTQEQQDAALRAIEMGCNLYARNTHSLDFDAWAAQEMLAEALIRRGKIEDAGSLLKAVRDQATATLQTPGVIEDPDLRFKAKERLWTSSLSAGEKLRKDQEPEAAVQLLEPAWKAVEADEEVQAKVKFKLLNNLALARINAASKLSAQVETRAQQELGLKELRRAIERAGFGKESNELRLAHATLAQVLWQIKPHASIDEILAITPMPEVADSEAGARALVWRAHALRHRNDPEAARICIERSLQILEPEPPSLPWCTEVLEQIAEYHESGPDPRSALPIRERLMNRWSNTASTSELINFVNTSTDLACAQFRSDETSAAIRTLEVALERARHDPKTGGLNKLSEARWIATNLLADLLRAQGDPRERSVRQEIGELQNARIDCSLNVGWKSPCVASTTSR
jgi:serine/threonine protein kinase